MAIYLLDNFGFDRLAVDNGYNCRGGSSFHDWFAEPVFRPSFDISVRRPTLSAGYNNYALHKPKRTLRQLNKPSAAGKCKVRCAADRSRSKLIDEQINEFLHHLYPMDVERTPRNDSPNHNNNNNNGEERTQAAATQSSESVQATAAAAENEQRQQTVEYTAKRIELDLQNFQPENVMVKVVDNLLFVEAVQEQKVDGLISKTEMKRRFQLPAQFDLQKIQCLFTRDGKLKIEIPCAKQAEAESTVLPIQMEEERSPVEEGAVQLAEEADSSSADLPPVASESNTMEE